MSTLRKSFHFNTDVDLFLTVPKVPTPSTVAAASALAAAAAAGVAASNASPDMPDKNGSQGPRSQVEGVSRTAGGRSATTDTVGTSDDDAASTSENNFDENTNKSLLNGNGVGHLSGGKHLFCTPLTRPK